MSININERERIPLESGLGRNPIKKYVSYLRNTIITQIKPTVSSFLSRNFTNNINDHSTSFFFSFGPWSSLYNVSKLDAANLKSLESLVVSTNQHVLF